ncbi:emp24p/erv25p- protein [Podila minutissima]|nr:emp24p/erv25p- protein [Podila minutissima]
MPVNKTRWAIALLVLLSVLPSVFGLYFYLEGSEQKCFLEELPKETLVTGDYTAEEWNEEHKRFIVNKDIMLEVIVELMPSGERVYSHKLATSGRFQFTSADAGQHAICLFTSTAGWFSSTKLKMTLDMQIRDMLDEAPELPEGSLGEMAKRVRDLNQKVGEIRREQWYLREHETDFRDKSEATNSHAVTWTIVQLVVLGLTCTAQLRSLRKFFETKKLV